MPVNRQFLSQSRLAPGPRTSIGSRGLPRLDHQDSINAGLVGYWSMDGGTISGTTLADLSGNGNNGSLIAGPTLVNGPVGQSLSFNGSSQYVSVSGTWPTGNAPRTMCAWVRGPGLATGLVGYGYGPPYGNAFSLGIFGTANLIYFGGYGADIQGVANLNDGAAHLILVYYDGTTTTIEVDGKFDSSGTPTLNTATVTPFCVATTPWNLGIQNSGGIIGKVRLWSGVLPSALRQRLNSDTSGNLGMLVPTGRSYYVSSGSVYSSTITESGTASDSVAVTASTFVGNVSESGTIADNTNETNITTSAITESGSAIDSTNGNWASLSAISESETIADNTNGNLATLSAITESGTIADSTNETNITTSAVSESGTIADNTNETKITTSAISESGSAIDSTNETNVSTSAISESGSAIDSTNGLNANTPSIVESASAVDSTNAVNVTASAIAETGSIADAANATKITTSAISETCSASDVVTSFASFIAAISESRIILDTTNFIGANIWSANVAETCSAIDSTSYLRNYLLRNIIKVKHRSRTIVIPPIVPYGI